jgi:hypothetical protein
MKATASHVTRIPSRQTTPFHSHLEHSFLALARLTTIFTYFLHLVRFFGNLDFLNTDTVKFFRFVLTTKRFWALVLHH